MHQNESLLDPKFKNLLVFLFFVNFVLVGICAYLAYQNWLLKKDILAIQFTRGYYTNKN